MKVKLLLLLAMPVLLVSMNLPASGTGEETADLVDVVLDVTDFLAGTHQGTTVIPAGLRLPTSTNTGSYTSDVISAPLSFNALVPHWTADVPESSTITLRLRTGTASGRWSDWFTMAENHDLTSPESTEVTGQMIVVPDVDVTHDVIQFSVSFSSYEGAQPPILETVHLTYIDTSKGPTTEELLAQQAELDQYAPQSPESGYPKPSVVSRAVWCTDSRCNYSDGLEYRSVSHLIVHHTVSSNSSSNWAAVVRAIWNYHYSRDCDIGSCWRDVGYNYLVDMNGVIYEGHIGGDDVVGTHAGGANAGSMALAFIGTFTDPNHSLPGIPPPQAMKNSAAELFAWKADQKNIDVHGSGYLPNISWILPNLMGHRDVYGTTECPGNQAHAILPWLRDEVASRTDNVSPPIYVDELSSQFTKSPTDYWYVPPNNCGYNNHAFYTWSVTNSQNSTNWGEWRPNLPASDLYEVEVFAPYCTTGKAETDGATYTITHANGVDTAVVSHQANVGSWMSIGTYYFNAGTSSLIRLTDLTTTDSGLGVWFDAIRFRPSSTVPDPSVANQQPASTSWAQQRAINFGWTVTNSGSISSTKLEVATDANFNHLVLNKSFNGAVTTYSHTFGQDYPRLYWRVILTKTQGGTVKSSTTHFGIDTESPTSRVQMVIQMEDGRYVLALSGNDTASGVAAYNIDYREEGGSWFRLLTNHPLSSASFTPPLSNRQYEFRSQAVDGVGHWEPEHAGADASTRDAILVKRVIMLPSFYKN